MNFYTSDLHFGHSNVIGFDHRPFADRVEMEQTLIYLWNDRVQKDDDIWIIGDFCFRADVLSEKIKRKKASDCGESRRSDSER